MSGEELLGAAVASNAAWCDAVCRSHGHPGTSSPRLWTSVRHHLRLYPHAITLSPQVTAPEVLAVGCPGQAYAVKDSFARLDLAPAGFQLLFEARWIVHDGTTSGPPDHDLTWDTVTSRPELASWERAWGGDGSLFRPALLADPRCAILACRTGDATTGPLTGGAIAYVAAGVTGLSNVFGTGLPAHRLWASAVQAVAALSPGQPITGYEHGASLDAAERAGFQPLGPLRVWARPHADEEP